MKYQYLAPLFLCLACSTPKGDNDQADSTSTNNMDTTAAFDFERAMRLESYLITDRVDANDVTAITEPCAVFIMPDSLAVDAMKKKYGDDFETIADDANWYYFESGQTLDSLGITQPDITTRYVEFKNKAGQTFLIDVRSPSSMDWNLFFFHPDKKPKVVSMVGLSLDSAKAYFNVK